MLANPQLTDQRYLSLYTFSSISWGTRFLFIILTSLSHLFMFDYTCTSSYELIEHKNIEIELVWYRQCSSAFSDTIYSSTYMMVPLSIDALFYYLWSINFFCNIETTVCNCWRQILPYKGSDFHIWKNLLFLLSYWQ